MRQLLLVLASRRPKVSRQVELALDLGEHVLREVETVKEKPK
jgi:hypothetical protein